MKTLIATALLLTSAQAFSTTCESFSGPTRVGYKSVKFTILAKDTYAMLEIKDCRYTNHLGCPTDIAIYSMDFRQTRLSIWDLQKISGHGPEALTWEEQFTFTPPHPAANCQDDECGSWNKKLTLRNGTAILCSK